MKILEINPIDGLKSSHRKEKHFSRAFKYINAKDGKTVVDLRLYWTGNTSYCCVWYNDKQKGWDGNGSHHTTGYGFHMDSDCAYNALAAAGVKYDVRWAAAGDEAMRIAITILGEKLNNNRKGFLIESYG